VTNPYANANEPGFNPAYRGTPPWDIGRAQPDFVRVEEAGEIKGSVLDVGCGTGENVLYLASRGHDAWGVDLAPLAIDIARRKAAERNIQATFIVADVFDLRPLGRLFDTVVDSGLLHNLFSGAAPGLCSQSGRGPRVGRHVLRARVQGRRPQTGTTRLQSGRSADSLCRGLAHQLRSCDAICHQRDAGTQK
jgi:SAM-dependent methyltransferase